MTNVRAAMVMRLAHINERNSSRVRRRHSSCTNRQAKQMHHRKLQIYCSPLEVVIENSNLVTIALCSVENLSPSKSICHESIP